MLSCHDFHNNETATVWQTNSFRNRKREQEKQIRPLVCEAAGEIESIFSLTCERMTEVFQKLNERQAQFLTPAQKVLLEEMELERRKFFHRDPKSNTVQHLPQPLPARTAEERPPSGFCWSVIRRPISLLRMACGLPLWRLRVNVSRVLFV